MSLPKAGVDLVAENAAQFARDMQSAGQAVTGFADAANHAGSRVGAFGEIVTGALRRVGEIAVESLGLAAQAAGQFIADSVTTAGDFEAAVNNLAAVSGDALSEAGFSFEDVSAKALQLGIDTRFSASESIAAMTELVKGGVPVAEVMDQATDATLNLAAAAGVDLANAAEIVSKQYGVWADTGVSATQITDLLTQAANASTVGVEDLALGLANAGGTAKTSGVEFADLVQTMALIAPNFSSASDAGTSLKTFISRLAPTTDPATVAMRDLGLYTDEAGSAFFDAQGQFIGMQAAAGLLQQATAGLSEEQRLLAFQTIFGSDAIRAAAAIAEAGAAGFDAMGASMASAGTAASVAAIQNQGFNFAMDSLKGSVETLQIVLGSALLPLITSFVTDVLTPGVGVVTSFAQALMGNQEALATLSPPLQTAVGIVQAIGGAFADAGPFSAEFAESLSLIHPALQPIMLGIGTVVSFLQNNWPAAVAVAGAVLGAALVPALAAGAAAFGTAIAAAAPVVAVLGVVGAAAAVLYGAWTNNFGGIQEATTGALSAIQSVVTAVLSQVLAFWEANGAQIIAFAQQSWTKVQQIVGNAVAIVATLVQTVFGGIASFINAHGSEIQAVLSAAWQFIANAISLALNTIEGITKVILGVLQGDWSTASQGIQQIVRGLVSYAQEQFQALLKTVQAIGPLALDAARAIGTAIVNGIVNGIKAGIGAVTDAARQLAQDALAAAKGALGIKSPSARMATEVGAPIAEGVAAGILNAISTATDAAAELGDEVIRTLTDMAQRAQQILDDVFAAQIGLSRSNQGTSRGLMDAELDTAKAAEDLNKRNLAYGDAVEAREAARAKSAETIAGIQAKQQQADLEAARKAANLERQRALAIITANQNVDPEKRIAASERIREIDADLADLRVKRTDAQRTAEQDMAKERQRAAAEDARLAERITQAQRDQAAAARAYNTQLDRSRLQQQLLTDAQAETDRIAATDPVAAQAFLKLRQQQIAELLDLQAEYDNASGAGTRELLARQLAFLKQAQAQELAQLQTQQQRRADELAAVTEEAAETGNAMVDGIIAAIRASTSGLTDALATALRQAVAGAQASLGIRSPSTVLAEAVGAPMALGVGAGFTTALPGVVTSMQQASRAMVASVARPVAGASYSTVRYGDTSVSVNGSGLSEVQLERAISRALDARTSRADTIRRMQ